MQGLLVAVCLISYAYGLPTDGDSANKCSQCMVFLDSVFNEGVAQIDNLRVDDVRDMCTFFPPDMQDHCHNVVESAIFAVSRHRNIDKRLLQDLCFMAKQCKVNSGYGDRTNKLDFHGDVVSFNSTLVGLNLPCIICQEVLGCLQTFLKNPNNQKLVLGLIEKLCTFLPVFEKQCINLVQEYGKTVIELMVMYLRPQMCTTFGLCPRMIPAVATKWCEMCEFFVGVLYDTIRDPALQLRVNLVAKSLCSYYRLNKIECDALVSLAEYVPDIKRFAKKHQWFWSICESSPLCFPDAAHIGEKPKETSNTNILVDVL